MVATASSLREKEHKHLATSIAQGGFKFSQFGRSSIGWTPRMTWLFELGPSARIHKRKKICSSDSSWTLHCHDPWQWLIGGRNVKSCQSASKSGRTSHVYSFDLLCFCCFLFNIPWPCVHTNISVPTGAAAVDAAWQIWKGHRVRRVHPGIATKIDASLTYPAQPCQACAISCHFKPMMNHNYDS